MKMLIDTNILVYAHNLDSPHNSPSKETIRRAIAGDFTGYLSIRNLVEFFSVITNPKRVTNPLASILSSRLFPIRLIHIQCLHSIRLSTNSKRINELSLLPLLANLINIC